MRDGCVRRATTIGESNAGSTIDGPMACTSNGRPRSRCGDETRAGRARPERTRTTIIVIGIATSAHTNGLLANTPPDSSAMSPAEWTRLISHLLGIRSNGATRAIESATRAWRSNQRAAQSGNSAMPHTFCVAAPSPLLANANATRVAAPAGSPTGGAGAAASPPP